ncbi:MAG: hypothetical protein LBS99_01035 [Clostridiales bacterium]|nr:hypothetical protein [Clostridiales bacterium]
MYYNTSKRVSIIMARDTIRETVNVEKKISFFTKVSDFFTLVSAGFYIIYIVIMLAGDRGYRLFNLIALCITVPYFLLFLLRAILFRSRESRKRVGKAGKITARVYKYAKRTMSLINAGFIILTVANMQAGDSGRTAIVGALFTIFFFILSVVWDISRFLIARKLRAVKKSATEKIGQKVSAVKGIFTRRDGETPPVGDYEDYKEYADESEPEDASPSTTRKIGQGVSAIAGLLLKKAAEYKMNEAGGSARDRREAPREESDGE